MLHGHSFTRLAAVLPPDFVADKRGSARFFLQRTIGGQQVRVDVDCTPVPAEFDEDYDEEEEQQEEEVRFSVVACLS